ncbi:SRPBCC family protein [Histidinibacterium aquaticum]|uniref:SRPBCC family protein n=1 Tax=Histidinibacterium aquaticum TaxID=2613962 RepID=UPI00168AE6C7|nr:SRPBCC family protein [Histidinibacterium aquaticum]
MTDEDIAPNDLVLVRHLPATPENVYRCWTEPELIKQFFAPAPGTCPEAQVDPRPGGAFRVVMEFEEHGRMDGPPGCVLIAEPGRRFAWTDALGPEFRPKADGFFSADITFTAIPEGCEYRVVARHADADSAQKHREMGFEEGWGTVAEQLGRLAATL